MCEQREWLESYISAVDTYAGYLIACDESNIRPSDDVVDRLLYAVRYAKDNIERLDNDDLINEAKGVLVENTPPPSETNPPGGGGSDD